VTRALSACTPHFVAQTVLRSACGETTPPVNGWSVQLNFIRWQLGKLTWVPLRSANPLLFLAAGLGLLLGARRTASPVSGAILAGALCLVACQPYVLQLGTHAEPRYLLAVSFALWLGWALLAAQLPPRAGRLVLVLIGILLPFQMWRAWHNESYFGTIAGEREFGRRFAPAIRQAQKFAGTDPVRVAPCSPDIPLAARAEAVIVRAAAPDVSLPHPAAGHALVWMLGSQSKARPTLALLSRRWYPDAAAQEKFVGAAQAAAWTVVVESADGVRVIYF
jgi:hypothetical protein